VERGSQNGIAALQRTAALLGKQIKDGEAIMTTYRGTAAANHLIGTAFADTILGLAGNDTLEGLGGNDVLKGAGGSDTLSGGDGADTLSGGRGNDVLSGGNGNDAFLFAAGDRHDLITDLAAGDVVRISGYTSAQSVAQVGADVLVTLSTGDTIRVANSNVSSVNAALQFGDASGGDSGGGGTGATITGTNGWDTLNGTAGNDVIYGRDGYDVIHGGGGNDRIYGGLGGDGLYGGAGADVFVYTTAAEGPQYGLMYYEWDIIYDFQTIDTIDLAGIDANTSVAGNQSFHFAGYNDYVQPLTDHSAGSLYIRSDGHYADVIGFTDGDANPDFYVEILLGAGQAVPTLADLIL
jgi:Ca2+-binding RTX toxin-like protein